MLTSHERLCTKDYFIPDMNITIPKGRMVKVYFTPFQTKEENFKNPHQFDPDNFIPEHKPNKFAYMNFGQGPRACPGTLSIAQNKLSFHTFIPAQRYAQLVQKIFLVHLLKNHRPVASAKSNLGDIQVSWVNKYDNIFYLYHHTA